MTTKFQQEGDVITYANAGSAITAGSVVVIGNVIGVALVDIAATTGTGAVQVSGVFASIPKVTGTAWTMGAKLLYDVSASKFDLGTATPATGDVLGAAFAWAAAASGDTTGVVCLRTCNTTVT